MDIPMLTSDQLPAALNPYTGSGSHEAAVLSNELIRLPDAEGRNYEFPAFQFAEDGLIPLVAEVNQILQAGTDARAVAHWWYMPSAHLEDHPTPVSLLGTDWEGQLLELARVVISG